jgi:hypothetical protein
VRFTQLTGIRFSGKAVDERWITHGGLLYPVDIKELEPRVKRLNVIESAEGISWRLRSCSQSPHLARSFLLKAITKFHSVLLVTPGDPLVLWEIAFCYQQVGRIAERRERERVCVCSVCVKYGMTCALCTSCVLAVCFCCVYAQCVCT